jgi:hypothetical protein
VQYGTITETTDEGRAMNFTKRALTCLSLGMAATLASPAMAEPILLDDGEIGESFTVSFDGFVDGGAALDGLSSQLQMTLTSILNGVYNFDYALTNTGATDDSVSSRVSGFAFNTDPEIEGADSTGTFGTANLDKNYPNGIGKVDVCFIGGNGKSCAGGGGGGVFDGETGSGTLALDFGETAPLSLTLDDFFVRYQSIEGLGNITSASGRQIATSSTSGGSTSGGSTSGGTEVPAPGVLGLLAMAVLAAFGIRRRKPRVQPGALTPAYA